MGIISRLESDSLRLKCCFAHRGEDLHFFVKGDFALFLYSVAGQTGQLFDIFGSGTSQI